MMTPFTNIMIYLVMGCMPSSLSYGQSLARKKPITLSQLSGVNPWNTKSGVVDGNYNRNAKDCGCCADSGRGLDPWIEIDLGEVNTFTRIVVYGRTDFSNSINNIDRLAVVLDNVQVHMTDSSDIRDPYFCHIDLGRTMSARKIKLISKGANKRFIVCEVDVFYDSVISTRKAIEASSTYNNWKPTNAVDGLIRTNDPDVCLCCAATQPETNPWLKLDLGDTFFITLIQLYGRTDSTPTGQSFEGMSIDIDGINMHTIPTSGTHIDFYELFPITDKIGRFIKLTLTGENRVLTVCEMIVYGERVISINKTAEQVSQYFSWQASRAVDGQYETHDPDDFCAGTEIGMDPWLKVYLGQNHKISRIVIYGRTDKSYPDQSYANMNIEVDSTSFLTIPTSDQAVVIDFYAFQLSSMLSGQLVKLVLQGQSKQLVVCELVVYGDCVDGYFGENCDQRCYCKGDFCNMTGICPSGICEPGYVGDTCSKQCDSYRYGQNCTETCGECRKNEVCDHVTGLCTECADGYTLTDMFCKTNCTLGSYGYNCSNSCGQCRESKPCNIINGHCDVCADGYKSVDILCMTVCDNGTYGNNCLERCGNCRNDEVCNKVNGQCTECADGYMEINLTCKTRCRNGIYGKNCSYECGACKDHRPCNFADGTCEDCSNGYSLNDRLCKTGCASYLYGYNCTGQCGQCRNNETCNPNNGECTQCEPGYNTTDPLCKTTCDDGFYGLDCQATCGNCFGGEICQHVNGNCSMCSVGFVGATCTERIIQRDSPPEDSTSVGPIAGGIVGAIAIAAIVIVAVIFLRKRRQINKPVKNSETPATRKPTKFSAKQENVYVNNVIFDDARLLHSEVNETLKGAPEKIDDENVYYNFTPTTGGILIHDLWDFINKNKLNKGEGFEVEFKKLRDGLIFTHNDALANRKKTRYKEMFPYDHSRVHLKVEKEGESEFINASHIDGFDETRKFIASQGPIIVMVDDFWRMVWQQNSTIIVMLTNLFEAGNQKCMQYWPDEGSVYFARITITMIQENDFSDYIVRTLDIQQDGGTPRRIRQFHFKAWPDKDVPDSTWSLTQFWREVFRDNNKDRGPIVVHCSAGVGRTGTFIALDNLYHQASTTGKATPLNIVENLRNQRVKMVQTSNQYMYLHEALADLMLFGTHSLWLSQFPAYYDFMIKKDKDLGKVRLTVQYEYLEKSLDSERSEDGTLYETPDTVKEIDAYRPKSATSVDREPGKLCTLFLPALNGPDSFILTTVPDDKSIRECWKLIDDYNVETVITLTDDTKKSYESIWGAINDKGIENHNPVLTADNQSGQFRKRQFTYARSGRIGTQGDKRKANIKQVEVHFSCKPGAETQTETVLTLLDLVSNWQPYISTKTPVMIQCSDGISNSGVMSVLLNEKQRMLKEGGQINILESVMILRRANRSCISEFSQYKFIHDIMLQVAERKEPVSAEEEIDDVNIYQNV